MWDLFCYGRKREGILSEATANAWRGFRLIKERTDNQEIIDICNDLEKLTADALKDEFVDAAENERAL